MLRGIDAAASGMTALQRRQDALTNNLANADTPGYKQDASLLRAFPKVLLERIHNQEEERNGMRSQLGTLQLGVYNQETLPLFLQGDLVSTNLPFDVAIQDTQLTPVLENNRYIKPAAFFAVQTPGGETMLTRNGRFTVNENGQLTTSSGDVVLNKNGTPISDPELASGDISIQGNGDIIVHPNDVSRVRVIGSIGVAVIQNPNELIKEGNGKFRLEGANLPAMEQNLPPGVQLHHKMIEQSNVDLTQTMADMMTNIKLYEANQKVIQTYDKTLEQLNTIGRV